MKQNLTKWIVGVVIVVIIVIIAMSSSKRADSNVIKIGYFGPFTGPVAGTTGEDVANAFKIANAKLNIFGNKKVEVIYEDEACDPTKAASAATKLINIDKVNILVNGVCSGSMLAAAPIAESHKVILFTVTAESPKITTAGDYIFRTSPSSVLTAHAMVQGLTKLGFSKIDVMFENAEYTSSMKDAFVAEFTQNKSNQILATQSFGSKDTDLRTPLAILAKTKPQILVVFANSTISANIILNQMKDLSVKLPVLGNSYFASSPAKENPNNNGNYVAVYKYDATAPGFTSMISEYKQKYGKAPAQEIYAANSYDGYNILFAAIKSCNGDNPECIKQALYGVNNYQGIGGLINIDENGDTIREFTLKQNTNGVLNEVK